MVSPMKVLLFTGFIISLSAACTTNPITSQTHFNLIPESIEQNMGAQAFAQVVAKEKISTNPEYNALVTRVGKRIAAVSGETDYKWEFKVIDSPQQNAFCLPGGKVAVYTGILPIAKNEAGLATDLGHEITHAIARHGGKRMTENLALLGGLTTLQNTVLKDSPKQTLIMQMLGLGATIGVTLPFSRNDETEADETGQILMARAGYDPAESIAFWDRFAAEAGDKNPPEFLSTHPNPGNRSAHLRSRLPLVRQDYANASEKFGAGESFHTSTLKSGLE